MLYPCLFTAVLLSITPPADTPHIDATVLGTIRSSTLTIPGSRFGLPSPGSSLYVLSGSTRLRIPSDSALVESWTDSQIILRVPESARTGRILVRTSAGPSNAVPVDVFAYDWFDIPPTAGTNAAPLSIAADTQGQVWVNEEFHLHFQHLDLSTGIVEGLPIPKPPYPGPFASMIFGDHRTQTSECGEDIIVDPHGRVWFSQGGGYLYSGRYSNHSRIVCYDPAREGDQPYRVYNLPGDWNEVIGLAWDESRGRLWAAQGGLVAGPKLISFDPERIPWNNHFDFSTSLMDQICPPGGPDADCYHVYDLPASAYQPAHMVLDDAGRVWYTAYWGNAIGVLDPESGAVTQFPLPKAIGLNDAVPFVGSGPWQIVRAPDGDIIFCEFFDSTISRFAFARLGDPACQSLDASGRNPCISDWIVPNVDLRDEQVHSIAFDLQGRLWYTQHGSDVVATDASLGYITPDWSAIVRLPPLKDFPGVGNAAADGIAVDPNTGDLYFCEFWRKRIGHLRQIR